MVLKRELVYINGKDRTNDIDSYEFVENKCHITFKNSSQPYAYEKNKIKIEKSAISSDKAYNLFRYLKKIANVVGVMPKKDDKNSAETKNADEYAPKEDDNILKRYYSKITFIPKCSILANYLNGTLPKGSYFAPIEIFPFGFNISQKNAVNEAFFSPLSVIKGPPGTGKTQTILNIIANSVMNGQSVAVVSSNNSATKNVYEKLQNNSIEFIAALLGNSTNKKEFIDSQTDIPDLSEFYLSNKEKSDIKISCKNLFNQLLEYLEKKNELAKIKQEIANIKTEYTHFQNTYTKIAKSIKFKQTITADDLLMFWLIIEKQAEKGKKFGFMRKIIFRIKYGIKDKSFCNLPFEEMISICQSMYYTRKIEELTKQEEELEISLINFSFDNKMEKYRQLSMQLFKDELYRKYNCNKRRQYTKTEFHSKSEEFIKDYPVIMSTTFSLRSSLAENVMYDFVIIDESSQVNLATGALALSCAKRAVIVGDLKQLPNVVNAEMKEKTDEVFDIFAIPEPYRYSNHSLLASVMEVFPKIPKTLLKEHYRCHPKIIEFCNQKFYNNQLIILTEAKSERYPLIVYKTSPGNHARDNMNQRQIDIIQQEIIPNEKLENVDLGIVTPYRNQTNTLQKAFYGTKIKADTVDKFQGRENDVIILSTVDNEISEFTDNPNRLNVAISRAIKQLILVINGNDSDKDSNIADLIRYIDYNNFSVKESKLRSVFDYLYKGYEQKREDIILNSGGKVSKYDSENLMYALIKKELPKFKKVFSDDRFFKYDVRLYFPLKNLISDFSKLNEQEKKYASHPWTHLDFLIYDKFGKSPVLAIEVDGYEYHEKNFQQAKRDKMKDNILEKYGLPLLRFSTTGSGEKQKLINKLREITA